jgi:hypothetical protein
MRRLAVILALVLGLTLLAAPPASVAVAAHAENRASGSATAPDDLIGIEAPLSEEAVRENVLPAYDLASDDAVAARGAAGTLKGLGNIGSHSVIDAGKALGAGQKWLGAGYKEIAPGVFRSADGLRQFRMTNADILGSHGKIGSHVHFEALNDAGKVIENLHLPVTP